MLILLPTDSNKLLMQWKDPFKVVERKGISDYRIDVNGKFRLFYANLLKKYNLREEELKPDEHTQLTSCAVIEYKGEDEQGNEQLLNLLPIKATQSYKDVRVNEMLNVDQKELVPAILHDFKDVLTDLPSRTDIIHHEVHLNTSDHIRCKP